MLSVRRKYIYYIVLVISVLVIAVFTYLAQPIAKLSEIKDKAEVLINDQTLVVDIADTQEKRSRGLMGREALGINEGMFFVFEEYDRHGFWMKNMNFPIDIIWISDGRVVGVERNAPPALPDEGIPTSYFPPVEVNRVLEVSAGRSEILNISGGDKVSVKTLVPSQMSRINR